MNENELKALIRLLEDEDIDVVSHVKARLMELGNDVIPILEHAWEYEADDPQQDRIADMIAAIQLRDVTEALISWKKAEEPSLIEPWVILSRVQYPELDITEYRNRISRYTHRIWLEFRPEMLIPEKLMVINRMLYQGERFQGNRRTIFDPHSYYLNSFLDTKRGSPLSLGLLYLVICQELELPITGLILPSYFVLCHPFPENEFFVDTFNKGAFFVRSDLERFLQDANQQLDQSYLEPATHVAIIRELIVWLADCHERRNELLKAATFRRLLQVFED